MDEISEKVTKVAALQVRIDCIKAEREKAKKEHELYVVLYQKRRYGEVSNAFQKATHKCARVHQYMGAMQVVDEKQRTPPYILKKQAIICMNMHNIDMTLHQECMLNKRKEILLNSMYQKGKRLRQEQALLESKLLDQIETKKQELQEISRKGDKIIESQTNIIQQLQDKSSSLSKIPQTSKKNNGKKMDSERKSVSARFLKEKKRNTVRHNLWKRLLRNHT
mmetsp:Transcript_11998/g.13761  ORF Transcript_11998/g.13761 Transcript_11998/m.13761 type:complete len:222 (+) Transcript_11998:221-886(+)